MESPPLATFSATWEEGATDPSAGTARGWRTHDVSIYPKRIVAEPHRLAATLRYAPIEYSWPAVVLERHRWLHHGDLLLEREGHIVRLALSGTYQDAHDVLERAEFEVVEAQRYGWVEPLALPRSEVQGFQEKLPRCMIAPYDNR